MPEKWQEVHGECPLCGAMLEYESLFWENHSPPMSAIADVFCRGCDFIGSALFDLTFDSYEYDDDLKEKKDA